MGVLVAAGQKDSIGGDRFKTTTTGTPTYRLRAFARSQRQEVEYFGLSDPTNGFTFVRERDKQRFLVDLDPNDPHECKSATILLKNSSLRKAGFIEIRAATGQEVEIANCAPDGTVRATIVLEQNGDIRLRPSSGRRIVLDGPLDAGLVSYQPLGGGPRLTL
jgi:hypothetical protein